MRQGDLLLIEDNPMDAELMREALESVAPDVTLHHAADGMEGMAFLRRDDAPRPKLVFVDINMPRLDGHGVMKEITDDESLRTLPVIALTTSGSPEDIKKMYARRCSGYVVKPADFGEFERALETTLAFWFDTVSLP